MNIALVDDVSLETERLTYIINEFMTKNNIDFKISVFNNAESLLAGYRPLQYNLIFLDIYMNGMTGTDAARRIREVDSETLIVFLTSSPEHTFEAFDVHAFHYILKNPVDEEFKEVVFKVLQDILDLFFASPKALVISCEGEEVSILLSDIIYAQSQKNYIHLATKDNSSFRIRMTFADLSSQLFIDRRFLCINRGIIVNMDYITSFGKEGCELLGDYSFPINVRNFKTIDKARKEYIFSKLHNR